MLIKKSWASKNRRLHYEGWFLFGILPIFIVRNGIPGL